MNTNERNPKFKKVNKVTTVNNSFELISKVGEETDSIIEQRYTVLDAKIVYHYSLNNKV